MQHTEAILSGPYGRKPQNRLLRVPHRSDQLTSKHSDLAALGSALLLDGILWKEDARDWKPLHGHENDLRAFVRGVGSAPPLCKSFVRLLDSVGSVLLPDALVWLDECLERGDPSAMIEDRNSLFSLARILTPLVFSKTGVLRKSRIFAVRRFTFLTPWLNWVLRRLSACVISWSRRLLPSAKAGR